MSDIQMVKKFIEHKRLRVVASRSGSGVKITLSKRDYPTQEMQSKIVSTFYEEFGQENITPLIRR